MWNENRDINMLLQAFYSTFQQIIGRKRYKLINFAPKVENVDNSVIWMIISIKILMKDSNK